MKKEYQVFEINNKQDAIAYMVKRSVNSIASDLTPLKMNAAEIISKIDNIFCSPENKAVLTEDQEIDLGLIRNTLINALKVIDDNSKNI
jgi:response regulator RpfG family c-di-GMP phosphodiesterase